MQGLTEVLFRRVYEEWFPGAIASAVATLIMGLAANLPFGLSSGMGLNAFFAYTVCGTMGYPWQWALSAIFVEGVIFLLMTFCNVREALVNSIP